jgi:ribonuclease HII
VKLFEFDGVFYAGGHEGIAGVDEAGRGPWAGPVVAAAVIFGPGTAIKGINDSKKLAPEKREALFDRIKGEAVSVGVGIVYQDVIDRINILEATFAAMREAVSGLSVEPGLVLVDGSWPVPGLKAKQRAIIGGDGKSAAIAAASIIAKVTRDRIMTELAAAYPQYAFERHKGYGTKEHKDALDLYGPCPLHRKSYAPVRDALEAKNGGR